MHYCNIQVCLLGRYVLLDRFTAAQNGWLSVYCYNWSCTPGGTGNCLGTYYGVFFFFCIQAYYRVCYFFVNV